MDDQLILEDLHFLIATDKCLQDEVSELCNLLDSYASDGVEESVYSTSSDTDSSTVDTILQDFNHAVVEMAPALHEKKPRRKRKKIIDEEPLPAVGARNKFQYRQKQEILRLRSQVNELQQVLTNSKVSGSRSRHYTERHRAILENEQLRSAVARQATLIDTMKDYMHKKRRVDAETYRLAAQHSLRIASIHAIADRQYSRQFHAFVKAGLTSNNDEVHISRALCQDNRENGIILEFINRVHPPVPFHVIGEALWGAMCSTNAQDFPSSASQTIEHVDSDTLYQAYTDNSNGVSLNANTICKKYIEDHRVVIAWRNVLEDELRPHLSRGALEQQWGWMVVEDLGSRQCQMTIFVQVPLEKSMCNNVQFAQQAIETFQFCTPQGGDDLINSQPIDPAISVLMTLLNKGRHFELAIRRAVQQAVQNYYYAMSQPAIRHDLELLIASDAQLGTELSSMCELLDTFSSDSSLLDQVMEDFSSPRKRKAVPDDQVRAKNKFQYRQRQEILQLRDDVVALQGRLAELKAKSASPPPSDVTFWAGIAKQELLTKTEALQENAHLRSEVDRQMTFVESMMALLRKRPLLPVEGKDSHMAEWKQFKLAASQNLRIAAIHAIADREYSKQQSAFLNAGLYPQMNEEVYRTEAKPQPNGSVLAKFIVRTRFDVPVDVISVPFWNVITTNRGIDVPENAIQTTECIDADTYYHQYHTAVQMNCVITPVHLNMIFKRYEEPTRKVFVWRSVIEDALVPHMSTGVKGVQYGWATIEPVPEDPDSCDFTFLCHVLMLEKDLEVNSIDYILGKMDKYGFCRRDIGNKKDFAHMRRSPMEVLMERGRQWGVAYRQAIHDNAKAYRKKYPRPAH
ncbi:hypothetical protein THRCLA_06928 [Thraustotheca clavata]|uniref:M96 mating-specific protein family n=1 Tax=Thraustotheca clavata TaxID=74557 RepID=A0A1V9ZHM0_9STRA|nr:hypothetical protein THRCLA_06928 [Thraustotheca clavata]